MTVSQTNVPQFERLGLSLLGADYERKKQKLKQELELDYKQYVAKFYCHILPPETRTKTGEPRLQPQGLSLLIDEKLSIKERLREERNKEYNLFLQNKANNRRLNKQTSPVTLQLGQVQASDAFPASPLNIPNTHTHSPPPHSGRPHRRDVATLTETVDNGTSKRRWDQDHRGRRQWQVYREKEPPSSEEEQITNRDEEFAFRRRRRKDRHTPEPEYKDEWRTREHRANRAPEKETVAAQDHNNDVWIWKSDLKTRENMTVTTRSRPTTSINKAEIATALMIGRTEDPAASQMKKEQYRQELLKQIAEERRNKIREKKLELRVAATGATDPEKEADRIKQFGTVNWHNDSSRQKISYKPGTDLKARDRDPDPRSKNNRPSENAEKGGLHGQSQMDHNPAVSPLTGRTVPRSEMGAPKGVPSLDYFNEHYHRDYANLLDVAMPRVASALPPIPPAITNNYQTPYDAPYYYYGTRNPLDPQLPSYQNGQPTAVEPSGNFHTHSQRLPPLRPSDLNKASDQQIASPLHVEKAPAHNTQQRRESYTDALRQQIKEREERKRREKEEKEQYNAKIEAEMMAYNPWGRSGGGAPIKDEKGNLFSDLNQMHKVNEDLYRNPVGKNSETWTPRSYQQAVPVGFNDQPTPLQLQMKEKYTQALKQQIEDNKKKKAEERAKLRAEEEKEEKRLAEQRARMLWEYEEEQRKSENKNKHGPDKQSQIDEPKTQPQKVEKRARQEKEIEIKISEITKERGVPSVSAPQTPLQAGQQEVLRQLSSLRRDLQKEKEEREMKMQRAQTDRQENHYTPTSRHRGRPGRKAFETVQNQSDYPPAVGPYYAAPHVNMQNIREFNQLKYRDTASREEVLQMYPDPPTDAESLDIQQQALLHRQQRKLRPMKREEHDFWEQRPNHYPKNKPGRFIHRDSVLPSESVFIDVYGGDAREELVHQQSTRRPSAEHQERKASGSKHDYYQVTHREHDDFQPDTQDANVRVHSRYRTRRLASDTGEHDDRSEKLPGDEVDAMSQRSSLERHVSMETIATEPWLRPGTSHFVKRLSS
ncbi:hypothetical protein Q5P01_004065 [Channa striata]|uniref:Centrosome and spindle pole-associated protein 1 C-terminal domain-containing protein n=1 Tax=Channa striata TaxID=64152 RepID=A0AA88NTM5_CHASR|nr:hypothetical protein Q5P01_004065 [Channa striata]